MSGWRTECFAHRATLAAASNVEIRKPAFATAGAFVPDTASGPENQQDRDAGAQAGQAQQPDLRIAQLQRALEHPAPCGRVEERQQALEDQHQRDRAGEQETHCYCFLTGTSAKPAPPEPRIALKKSEPVSTTITSDFLLKLAR